MAKHEDTGRSDDDQAQTRAERDRLAAEQRRTRLDEDGVTIEDTQPMDPPDRTA